MEYRNLPYWQLDAVKPNISPDLSHKESDVIIIGAGLTGLATALHMLRAGKSVILFDAMKVGDGASGRNGGMVGPSLHKLGLDGLTAKYGKQKALEILQEGINAIQYFKSFVEEEEIDCDFGITGRLRGIIGKKSLDQAIRQSESLCSLKGFRFDVAEKSNIHDEIGSDLYDGGIIYHLDGGLHPLKLLFALARKVIDLGGNIHQKTKVDEVTKMPTGFSVLTSAGIFKAGNVIVASNGYTKKFAPAGRSYFYKRLLPITSAMIATEELDKGQIDRMFPKKRMHGGNHRLVQYYRASPNHRRVLFGARGTDAKDRSLGNGIMLKKHMCKIFPELENVNIEYSWCGKVAYTFDHTPHLGQYNGVYYAMGYCGSGVTRSIYLARKLSRKILGLGDHHTAFDDLPFETRPFYSGNPWFMPAVLKWHSFLDHIHGN